MAVKQYLFFAFLVFAFSGTSKSTAQNVEPAHIYGQEEILYQIKDVAFFDNKVYALTHSEPVLHIFSEDSYQSWGEKGDGPAEFFGPFGLQVTKSEVAILDFRQRSNRIITFDHEGMHKGNVKIPMAMFTSGFYRLNEGFVTMASKMASKEREIVFVDYSGNAKTLFTYEQAGSVKIRPSQGPSFTLSLPYTNKPTWTISGGQLLYWDGKGNEIKCIGEDACKQPAFILHENKNKVTKEAREIWFDDNLPQGDFFEHQDPFRFVREKAREELSFPVYYPMVLQLLPDPSGGVWVQQTPAQLGAKWMFVGHESENIDLQFPPRVKVKAFLKDYILAIAEDEEEAEYVYVYHRKEVIK